MHKAIKLIFLVALVSALAAAAPRGIWLPGEIGQSGESSGLVAARTQGGAFRDVNLNSLGQDLIAGEYWTPTVDFSAGTKYYFDPDATVKGDGSLDSPFRSLAVEVASDSTIIRVGISGDTLSAGTAVVGGGDVCVLLGGNHGWIRFLEYYNSDYLALVGAPGQTATFDYLNIEEFQRFYIEDFDYSGKARYLRADAGDMTNAGYDNKPHMLYARRDSNGNGVGEYLIVKDCDFSGGTAAQAAAWSETEWDSLVCDAMMFMYTENIHVQGCTGTALGGFIKLLGSGTDPEAISIKHSKSTIINNSFSHLSGDGIRFAWGDSLHIAGNIGMDWYVVNEDHVDMMQLYRFMNHVLVEQNKMFHSTDPSRSPDDFGVVGGIASGFLISYDYGPAHNTVFRNNLLLVEAWEGISVFGGENVTIVNNTVIGKDEGGTAAIPYIKCDSLSVNYNASGIVIANNITGRAQHGIDVTGITTANNIEGIRDFSTVGFTTFTQDGDPTLWDLHLTEASPAVRAGSSTYAPATDYAGSARPDRVFDDVGAYVYDDPDVTAPKQITAALDYRNASSLQISWIDPVATDAWYCTVYRGTASGALDSVAVASMGDQVYYDDTIDVNTDYYFAVTCTDSSGNESSQREVSAPADATAPSAISDLLVTNYLDQVDLSWSAVAAADLDYYNVYRDAVLSGASAPTVDTSDLFDTVAGGTETYTDSAASTAADSTYYYAVAAVDSSGNVATLSNTVSATPEVTLTITVADSLYDETNELASVDFTTNVARMLSFRHQVDGGSWSSVTTLDSAVTAATHYVDTSDSTTYASGSRVNIQAYYASEDTAAQTVFIARTPADTTPPDTTGVFAGVTVDTTGADILLTLTDMTITGDPSQVEFQWSNDGGTTYYGDSSWSPTTASTTIGDTISTNVSTADLNGSLYTRFRLRDDEATPNVSGWNVNAQAFERAAAPSGGPDNYFTLTIPDSVVSGSAAIDSFRVVLTEDCFPSGALDSDLGTVFSGGGIRFVDSSGDTLAREIVTFDTHSDPDSAAVEIHLVCEVSPLADTEITCAYFSDYSEPDSNSTYGREAVWAGYSGVWHMGDLTSTAILNSAELGVNGTKYAAGSPAEVDGVLGAAQDFNGVNSQVEITDSTTDLTGDFTISAIINADSWSSYSTILAKRSGVTYQYHFRADPGGRPNLLTTGGAVGSSTALSATTTYHLHVSRDDDGNTVIYVDGSEDTSAPSQTISTQSLSTYIGDTGGVYLWDGMIDEVRIIKSVLSADWISTEYTNQNDPGGFAIEGALQ